jgi:uncharacterized lipoprotein YajG
MRSPFGIGGLALLAVVAGFLLAGCQQQSAPDAKVLDTDKLKQVTVSVTGMS